MGQKASRAAGERTHSCATTTPNIRRAIQASEEKDVVLAKLYGVNRKTVAKWKGRDSVDDERMGPKNPRSKVLTQKDEAIILAYRWKTRLPLDVCHDRLRRLMPELSRSPLYRCLERYGLSRIGRTATALPLTDCALKGPYTFEITANEVVFQNEIPGVIRRVFLAVEEITKHLYAEVAPATPENAAVFLANLVAGFPQKIVMVTTDIPPLFTDWPGMFGEDMAPLSRHPFALACRANKVAHMRTFPPRMKPPKVRLSDVEIR